MSGIVARPSKVRFQRFAQEITLVLRRPVEFGENRVAKLLIESQRLKAERIEPHRVAPPLHRGFLANAKKPAAHPLATQTLGDPKIPHEQPTGISLAEQSRFYGLLLPREDTERLP